tara:strand:+ start:69 stop:524 length:456 start_codon:yes stop_codon:yes gene_type:complete
MFNFFTDADVERVAQIIEKEVSDLESLQKKYDGKLSVEDFEAIYKSKPNFKYQKNDYGKVGGFIPMCEGFYKWNDELDFLIGRKSKKDLEENSSRISEVNYVGGARGDWIGVFGGDRNLIRAKFTNYGKGMKLYKFLVKKYSYNIRDIREF